MDWTIVCVSLHLQIHFYTVITKNCLKSVFNVINICFTPLQPRNEGAWDRKWIDEWMCHWQRNVKAKSPVKSLSSWRVTGCHCTGVCHKNAQSNLLLESLRTMKSLISIRYNPYGCFFSYLFNTLFGIVYFNYVISCCCFLFFSLAYFSQWLWTWVLLCLLAMLSLWVSVVSQFQLLSGFSCCQESLLP